MIPKIIHYCWFGPTLKSIIALECIESWKTFCPDFEFKEWNENNIGKYQNKFYKDAYRKKRYAFVSDCIRTQVLLEFGGVYLDTDMLLLKPIDGLMKYDFFTGIEVNDRVAYGLFGSIPNHRLLEHMVDFYQTNEFNEFSLPVITHTFKENINKQTIKNNEIILPPSYFYPLPYEKRFEDHLNFTSNESYAVHLWDHTWKDHKENKPWSLFKGLKTVTIDYLFYGYSRQYFIRYFRGFSRQLYYYFFKKVNK